MILSSPAIERIAKTDSDVGATHPPSQTAHQPYRNDKVQNDKVQVEETDPSPLRSNRTNEDWVTELRDRGSPERQCCAHEGLSSYLYVVAYNYLKKRTNDIQRLDMYRYEEIEELARDFVQSFMEKLAKNEYALLDKFSGTGRFTSWAAQVTNNLIASELRKPYWQRQYMPNDGLQVTWVADEESVTPHNAVEIEEIMQTVRGLLSQLPEQQRMVLLRCVAGDERTADVAEELGMTANALYIVAHRAKAKMRKLLEKEGVSIGELALFNS